MMGAITIFPKKKISYLIVDYGWVRKSLGAGCTFEKVA